jgi:hypothetical protein
MLPSFQIGVIGPQTAPSPSNTAHILEEHPLMVTMFSAGKAIVFKRLWMLDAILIAIAQGEGFTNRGLKSTTLVHYLSKPLNQLTDVS